jgi:hypothetical protein
VDGLDNALSNGQHVESKWGKAERSASKGPLRQWRVAHLKRDNSGTTLVASRSERDGAAWLQASTWPNLRGGGEEYGELHRPARRDDDGTRGSSTTAECST